VAAVAMQSLRNGEIEEADALRRCAPAEKA
jgi:hypothetical protein